jgi:hypothetical protein
VRGWVLYVNVVNLVLARTTVFWFQTEDCLLEKWFILRLTVILSFYIPLSSWTHDLFLHIPLFSCKITSQTCYSDMHLEERAKQIQQPRKPGPWKSPCACERLLRARAGVGQEWKGPWVRKKLFCYWEPNIFLQERLARWGELMELVVCCKRLLLCNWWCAFLLFTCHPGSMRNEGASYMCSDIAATLLMSAAKVF